VSLPTRTLGPWKVSAIGLGGMPLSGMPSSKAGMIDNRIGAIAVIHAALDAGVTLIDTADIYAPSWKTFGHNESLVGEAFTSWTGSSEAKSKVVIATKGGITRGPNESWGRATSKDYFLRAAEASALRLRVDKIQLWHHHRLDPEVTFETQFENLLVLRERGLVEHLGVSNYSAEQLRRAIEIGGSPAEGGVISIQNQFSARYRCEAEVIDLCEEHGIAYLAWSPLGGVNLSSNLVQNGAGAFSEIGKAKNLSAFAIAIAWLLHRSPSMIPIPGATRIESIQDSLTGISLALSIDEIAQIEVSLPSDSELDAELVLQPSFRS
jgi:aryl-alcohol dehydrogenase-like predicted oxidoreductase